MTDAMQLAEIENERRRHLANWLIDSSPHMPKSAQYRGVQHKANDKLFNTSVFNDSFLLSRKSYAASSDHLNVYSPPVVASMSAEKPSPPQHTNFSFSKSNTPSRTSQSIFDNFEPSLRRFMAQDISANTFSVTEFELARQTRKIEKEQVKLEAKRKGKALNTGCDSSTGGSKRSNNEADTEPLTASVFFDRFRLPQIARISEPFAEPQSLENKTSKQSSLKSFFRKLPKISSQPTEVSRANSNACNEISVNSELFLLHRLCKQYKVYHAVTGKHIRKKNVKIPQDFGGYFSLVENGTSTAIAHTTITQLIRDKVFKFVSLNKLQGYTESSAKDHTSKKSHYSKISVKSGEVLSLLAVFEEQKFEDGVEDGKFGKVQRDSTISSGREKKKGRYVQLMMENRKVIYVPISAKGKFFEVDTLKEGGNRTNKINPDCIYKIGSLINDETRFPLSIRLMVNTFDATGTASLDYLTVVRVSTEDFVIGCPFNGADFYKNAHLEKIPLSSDMKFAKTLLGFGSENELFANQPIQHLLRFCDTYCDGFVNTVEIERQEKIGAAASVENLSGIRKEKLKSKVLAKLLNSDKHSPAHEIEDSIIFISKSELERMDLNEKYLTPKKSSAGDRQQAPDREARPGESENTNFSFVSTHKYKNAKGEPLIKSSSVVSLDSRSSSRAFCKFFSMQSLEHNKLDRIDDISAGLRERYPDLVSLTCIKEASVSSSNNLESAHINQKSFVTEKLFNEFYHSTKQHSKSSFLLNQLLHFKAKKVSAKERRRLPEENRAKARGESALMHLTLPSPPKELEPDVPELVEEDLPYYHVHDAINHEGEELYAEICGAVPNAL